ncbi:MAG: hypothetical protein IPJ41_02100 [Phycisphaerales bacterium]|nr:hypothetical protein [Phycisphaerales bacterium]
MARSEVGKFSKLGVLTLIGMAGLVPAYGAGGPTTPPTVQVASPNSKLQVTDLLTKRVLLDQRNLKAYNNRNKPELVVPTMEVVAQSSGVDLVYTYTNDQGYARPLADMRVGTLVMPDNLVFEDTKMLGGQDMEISPDHRPSMAYTYPDNTYSPVYVLRDGQQAVGVSLLYPLFEYKHDVQFRLQQAPPPSGDEVRGWYLDIRVSNLPGDSDGRGFITYPASLAAGESRSYTVTVRWDRKPEEWVRTLLPYREYFRSHFGGVQYERRTDAIVAYSTSESSFLSQGNPYGFRAERIRPDMHGFGPMVDQMLAPKGWPELLVIKPSGQYFNARGWNYPFKMLTELETSPELQTAFDPEVGLASIPERGRHLSLWWGRALQVAEQWEPTQCHPLDPGSESDRQLAFAELDLARQAGATGIGLDTFAHDVVPVWESYAWLQEMVRRYPEMHFFTEPVASDVLHSVAPTWLRGWTESDKNDSPDDIYRVKGPHMLADFLLPGHEILLPMRYQAFGEFNILPSASRVNNDAQRFASWGFRPTIYSAFDLRAPVMASESWLTSIPSDLQIPRSEWVHPIDPYDGGNGNDPSNGDSGARGNQGVSADGSSGEVAPAGPASGGVVTTSGAARFVAPNVTAEEARAALDRARDNLAPMFSGKSVKKKSRKH